MYLSVKAGGAPCGLGRGGIRAAKGCLLPSGARGACTGSPTFLAPCSLPIPHTQAVSTAKPFVEQAVSFLTTTEPVVLGQYAVALVAAYYLVRGAWGPFFFGLTTCLV